MDMELPKGLVCSVMGKQVSICLSICLVHSMQLQIYKCMRDNLADAGKRDCSSQARSNRHGPSMEGESLSVQRMCHVQLQLGSTAGHVLPVHMTQGCATQGHMTQGHIS